MEVSKLSIRPLQRQDSSAVFELYAEYSSTIIEKTAFDKAIMRYPSAVILKNTKVIGFCYTARFSPDILEIRNIYVNSDDRNKGIGSKLIRFVEDMALDIKMSGLILCNSDLNETINVKASPRNFYERQGFQVVCKTDKTRVYFKQI